MLSPHTGDTHRRNRTAVSRQSRERNHPWVGEIRSVGLPVNSCNASDRREADEHVLRALIFDGEHVVELVLRGLTDAETAVSAVIELQQQLAALLPGELVVRAGRRRQPDVPGVVVDLDRYDPVGLGARERAGADPEGNAASSDPDRGEECSSVHVCQRMSLGAPGLTFVTLVSSAASALIVVVVPEAMFTPLTAGSETPS